MRLVSAGLAILFVSPVALANAELKSAAPSEVCAALNALGLPTSVWKPTYGRFDCLSNYKRIGDAFPLANNLAYYAEGDRARVTQVKLVLNVNDPRQATTALNELLKAAGALCPKVTGNQLPAAIRAAIRAARKGSAKAGVSLVEVTRDNQAKGKGYSIEVVIR